MSKKSAKVDWDELGNPLPVLQVPREQDLRKEIFDKMDGNNNGHLTMTECLAGLPALMEDKNSNKRRGNRDEGHYLVPLKDLRPAATAAFKMAREVAPPNASSSKARKDNLCVDRREFHALLTAFKLYIELQVLFEKIDGSGVGGSDDRRLSWKEIQPHVDLLESWKITAKAAKGKFKDDWTPCMEFDDFSEWAIMTAFREDPLILELDENDPEETLRDAARSKGGRSGDIGAVVNAFKEWDSDESGCISKEELSAVLLKLDETFTQEMADKLFELADVNQDGKIDYVEFSNWVTGDKATVDDGS